MSTARDDELDAWMARLADGDRSAFSLVFKRLWTPIFRFCASLVKNEADASDAAQQAMQKILERASDYDPGRPALPWAFALAAWECKTLQRKHQRRREVAEDTAGERATEDGEDAEDEMVRRDLVAAALSALGELSEVDRETLIATFQDQAPSGATVRKRRERALDRFRNAFKRIYGLE